MSRRVTANLNIFHDEVLSMVKKWCGLLSFSRSTTYPFNASRYVTALSGPSASVILRIRRHVDITRSSRNIVLVFVIQ